ncbi:MAG TPA: hypothetical protein DCS93_23585 [Microscillaceae bacterium]|nr:hypothetical protein [Microscillaceae bacterium]
MDKQFNPLLRQQLEEFFQGQEVPENLSGLLESISNTYDDFERDHQQLEKRMEMHSQELNEANHQIKLEAKKYQEAEALARKSEQILRSINEHINEAIFRHTPDKGIVYINHSFLDLFEFEDFQEINNVSVKTLFANEDAWDELQEKLEDSGFYKNEEVLLLKKDGTPFWGLMSCILSTGAQGNSFYDGAIVDIDAQKRTQNRLIAINEELKKANAELDRFVYSASHDLRAPLKSLLGLLQLIEYDTSGNIAGYLDKMRTSVQKLDYFIEEIIDYSMNARMERDSQLIDFEELIGQVLEKLQYLPGAIRIEKKVAVNGSCAFYSDRSRCLILFNNLLSNAIVYHNLQQAQPLILIKVEVVPEQATITIQDNGKGIDEKHLQDIFKMFYRASVSSNGSGLGLYIVKEILQKLNGSIEVTSTLHKGTSFTFTIPNSPPVPG